MTDARAAAPQPAEKRVNPIPDRTPLQKRLDRLVGQAGAVLVWERAWPVLWGVIGVGMLFLALSWLGLWLDLNPGLRMAGVALFALAGLAALLPLARLRRPARDAALDRLDRDAGIAHRPARALEDTLALGEADAGTRALWDLHRKRAEGAVARLRVAAPSPGMARRDRYAFRAAGLVAVVASAFVAGPEVGPRLFSAFDWREPAAAGPLFRVDGWIDPPLYTRTPPLMIDLASGEQRLRAPVRSTVVIRVAGQGDVGLDPGPGLFALPVPESQRADLRERRYRLDADATLSVRTGLVGGTRLHVEAIPDKAPEIALAGQPEINARGTFVLSYRAKDDYGLTGAEGLVEKADGSRRSLVPAPRIALTLPSDTEGEADTRTTVDLTEHAWAGARVKLTLAAKDEAEQEGRSETITFTLPQKPFVKPLAKALVEQRRRLVVDPDERRRVQTALDALLIEPEMFTPQWGIFLGLRTGTERLRAAKTDDELREVADWLWAMALQIEEGDLSDAERDLRAAQERLREAMERNAPPDEISRLMQEMRAAMDRFLREFAERMQREQQQQGQNDQQRQQSPSDRVISQDDLNRMMQQMEEAMRRGDMAEAQRLLEEMRSIMENLQTARPNRSTDPMAREMQRGMEDLDQMLRDEQALRDETFRDGQQRRQQQRQQGRQQGQQGQRGQRQPGQQGQQGEQGEGQEGQQQSGEGQQPGQGLGQRQQALRERLQELQRRMKGMGMQGEQGLGDAEDAMREAEGALGQGQEGQAVDAQGRAIEGLQRGMQGMAQQMQQMMGQEGDGTEQAGDQPGQGDPRGRAQNGQRDNDPLGRPTRSRDFSDGRVRVPTANESASERARRILEELRRKLGEPNRRQEELDYFERLLRRN